MTSAGRPVDQIARDLRELRRTLAVVRATEAIDPADPAAIEDLRRRYDAVLLEAARAVEVSVRFEWLATDGGLSDIGRIAVVSALVDAGLAVEL